MKFHRIYKPCGPGAFEDAHNGGQVVVVVSPHSQNQNGVQCHQRCYYTLIILSSRRTGRRRKERTLKLNHLLMGPMI